MPRVIVNRWKFLYRQAGTGPDVVLLPGLASAASGRNLFDALTAEFRVTLYQARFRWASRAGTSADLADDFRGLHEKLGLEPAYLVGHREAALAALHAAVLYPEAVAGLVLTEPCLNSLREHAAPGTRSGLTTRRIQLVDRPVAALCGRNSTALPMCRFLQENLPQCQSVLVAENGAAGIATICDCLREMAGLTSLPANPEAVRVGKAGPHGFWSRLWSEAADGHAIARWMAQVSGWRA